MSAGASREAGGSPPRIEVVVEAGAERLDVAVARAAGVTRSQAARLIDAGAVRVDGMTLARSAQPERGARITIELPEPAGPPAPEEIPLRVVYEDPWLLVVAKPAGLVVHPAPGHASGTLVNALLARSERPAGGEPTRPGIVHRLDRGTSGLMIVAKEEAAFERLREMMAAREITRTYLALVEGEPAASGTIDAPVGRSSRQRKKMAVVAGGRDAVTAYRRLESFAGSALLEVSPRTGRTHQIRVHLAAAGHPVVGDAVYGGSRSFAESIGLRRPFLHAARLQFAHPVTGEQVDFAEPLPEDLREALDSLRGGTRS